VLSDQQPRWQVVFEGLLFVVGFGSATLFYIVSQRQLARGLLDSIRYIPAMMAVGAGIAFNNAVATLDGFFGKTGEFVRTPKFGDAAHRPADWRRRLHGFRNRRVWQAYAELVIGLYLTACLIGCFFFDHWLERVSAAMPFLAIFIVGYFYVAYQTLRTEWSSRRAEARFAPA
jgi:hypothetical protein